MIRYIRRLILEIFCLALLPLLAAAALLARWQRKPVDIGLGPEPLINNLYHKRALRQFGYTAETFVTQVYYITTDFDIRFDLLFGRGGRYRFLRPGILFNHLAAYFYSLFHYRCLYLYFHGGPLSLLSRALSRFEPFLYHLAGVRLVVMPYGGDVQAMSRSPNLLFKHALAQDYPQHSLRHADIVRRIDLWTRSADHIISGCEWVDYMYHWDTLMLGHFSIDTGQWTQAPGFAPAGSNRSLRILHAPNHRAIKGSQHFINAVEELQREGLPLELVILERVPNDQVRQVMAGVDIVADQLIIGWYAMFALEAMSLEKPVLCYLRPDLVELYTSAGLIEPGEIPIINCSPRTVKETLRELALHPERLAEIGASSRQYVLRRHSIAAVGAVFDRINRSLGVLPSQRSES